MATIAIYAQKNEKKEDYVNFDKNGTLISFQKTDLGGTIYEVDELLGSTGSLASYYPFRVTTTNGDVYDGEIDYKWGAMNSIEEIYRAISENKFDPWWKIAKHLDRQNMIRKSRKYADNPVTITTNAGWVYNLGDGTFRRPVDFLEKGVSNGDYMEYGFKFPRTEDSYFPSFDYEHAEVGGLYDFQITYKDGLVKSCYPYWSAKFLIEYLDGSTYEGTVVNGLTQGDFVDGWGRRGNCYNDNLLDSITSVAEFSYLNGVFTDKKGKCTAYKNGKEDALETARAQQSKDKEREEKIKKEAEERKAIAALEKKYGKKYTNAVLKGNLILGMPEELFLLGVSANAFKRIYGISLDYKSASYSSYKVYGWEIGEHLITNRAYLGNVYFSNGKLKSMDFK